VCDSDFEPSFFVYEILQYELNKCDDVSLCSCSYTLENVMEVGVEVLIIKFPNDISVR